MTATIMFQISEVSVIVPPNEPGRTTFGGTSHSGR